MIRFLSALAFFSLMALCPAAKAEITADQNAAVIYVYQRIGEDSMPAANLARDMFEAHLRELKAGGYTVLSLTQIADALRNGGKLPPKTVGISFDGAFKATLENAIPLLESYKFPFTVFVTTDTADQAAPEDMGWDDLRRLQKNKLATIGVMPAAYAHMASLPVVQSESQFNKAVTRYREELGQPPVLFAWPYGEYTPALQALAGKYAFAAGFGQQSGVAYDGADLMALPRFLMTDDFGDIDRFRMTASARPLPVTDIVPSGTHPGSNPPEIGFTVDASIADLARLSCFASSSGKVPLEILGQNRVELRLKEPFLESRTRINCTLPIDETATGDAAVWRWFGLLFTLPGAAAADGGNNAPPAPDMNGSLTE